ncbi:MAG TPA: hypothetical protein V6D05_07040 [Stenomitos sp.]
MFGMQIPSFMLKQMYKAGSLKNQTDCFEFTVCNPVMDATIVTVKELTVGGTTYRLEEVEFTQAEVTLPGTTVSEEQPVDFGKGDEVAIRVKGTTLNPGEHSILLHVHTVEFGSIRIEVQDTVRG